MIQKCDYEVEVQIVADGLGTTMRISLRLQRTLAQTPTMVDQSCGKRSVLQVSANCEAHKM